MFEKPKTKVLEGQDDEPLAIYMIYLDQESRLLALAGGTHVMLFKFSKQEGTLEVPVCWTIHQLIPVYYCYKFNYPLHSTIKTAMLKSHFIDFFIWTQK